MTERIDHVAKAVKAAKDADAYLLRIDGQKMSDAQAVVSQLAAMNANIGAVTDAQLAMVEQQRIANRLQVAAIDQQSEIARLLAPASYPVDPSIGINGYLTDTEWAAIDLDHPRNDNEKGKNHGPA